MKWWLPGWGGGESKISRRNEKLISKRQIYSGKRTKDQITQIRSQQAGLGGAGGVPYLCWMSWEKQLSKVHCPQGVKLQFSKSKGLKLQVKL